MSRSGYSEDWDGDGVPPEFYRTSVAQALRGKRGQAFLRELIAALDALPEKRLIVGELEDGYGCVCSLGAVGKARGIDMTRIGYDPDDMAKTFGLARCMAAEIMFENDDEFAYRDLRTPEQNWQYMRNWAESGLSEPQGGNSDG